MSRCAFGEPMLLCGMPTLPPDGHTPPALSQPIAVQAVHQGVVVKPHQNLTVKLVPGPAGLVAEVARHGKADEAPEAGQGEIGLMLGVDTARGAAKLYISNGLRETVHFRAAVIGSGQTSEAQDACAPAGTPAFVMWPDAKATIEVSEFRTGGGC